VTPEAFRAELENNILPFWMERGRDNVHGGFHGLIDCDGEVHRDARKAAVIHARALWTFSAATRMLGARYRDTADHAFKFLAGKFVDAKDGGIFWTLDHRGRPTDTRKQIYAQAFAIYGLSEYYRATGDAQALDLAKALFGLIEEHAFDPRRGGYVEALDCDWRPLSDMRLSDKDMNAPKSMNTHLHVLEAYTNLLRVWRDDGLLSKHHQLLDVMFDRITDAKSGHFKLFFDMEWTSLGQQVSFGHDIEGSWLLVEAAEGLGDRQRIARAREIAIRMAEAVLAEGVADDGSLLFEADAKGHIVDATRHWWVQAEAVIGFHNAYRLSGEARFRDAAARAWAYIECNFVNPAHGEWHAKLSADGIALTAAEDGDACLAGPWKCPYHNGRMCLEMMVRLEKKGTIAA